LEYRIEYKASVARDLRKLDKKTADRILSKVETDLSRDPNRGLPLKGEFEGLFRYRVGDHRAIYSKTPRGILILRIAHRKEAYR